MSQNAVLDREAINVGARDIPDAVALPVVRSQREHLTLMDWNQSAATVATASAAKAATGATASAAKAATAVVPARRPWFGWSEACTGLLLLAAGAACLSSLLNL